MLFEISDKEIEAAARWMVEQNPAIDFKKAVSYLKRQRTVTKKEDKTLRAAVASGMTTRQALERHPTDLIVRMGTKGGHEGRPSVSCLGGSVMGYLPGDVHGIVIWPPAAAAEDREEAPLIRSWIEAGCPDDHPWIDKYIIKKKD